MTTETLPLLTDAEEATIRTALAMLHSVVATRGDALFALTDGTSEEQSKRIDKVLVRTSKALNQLQEARLEAAVGAFRQGAADIVLAAIAEAAEQRLAFAALPAALRARLGNLSDTISIPLASFAALFPANTGAETIVDTLRSLKYDVSRPSADKARVVRVADPSAVVAARVDAAK